MFSGPTSFHLRCLSFTSIATETVRLNFGHRHHQYVDDNMGGHYSVSEISCQDYSQKHATLTGLLNAEHCSMDFKTEDWQG